MLKLLAPFALAVAAVASPLTNIDARWPMWTLTLPTDDYASVMFRYELPRFVLPVIGAPVLCDPGPPYKPPVVIDEPPVVPMPPVAHSDVPEPGYWPVFVVGMGMLIARSRRMA